MSRREVLENFIKCEKQTKQRVEYGVENYRKGNFTLKIVDENLKPIQNAKVEFNQKSHEFKYGANLFMLDELENEEKNELYKKYFKEFANMATLPFYWNDLEPERGKPRYAKDSPKIYRRPAPDLCIEWCKKNGIEPREHALAYNKMYPEWVAALSLSEQKAVMEKHFKEIADRYADKIPTIEVTNETGWGTTSFYKEKDYIEWCFKKAEEYFPKNKLVINEFTSYAWQKPGSYLDPYYLIIERNLSLGARIDAIGFQYHIFCNREDEKEHTIYELYNPEHLFKIMDRYADFNLPIHITEVTVPAYSLEKDDEEMQAEIIKRLYEIWFSQKEVEQIIYWNLVDGYAAFAPQGDFSSGENVFRGGLLRFDLSPKPAYYAIKDLFTKTWHSEGKLTADSCGKCGFKGFYGEYDLRITVGDKTYAKSIKCLKNGSCDLTVVV